MKTNYSFVQILEIIPSMSLHIHTVQTAEQEPPEADISLCNHRDSECR